MGFMGLKEMVVIVDGVDESDVKVFGVEEFSYFYYWVDMVLCWVRYVNYVLFLGG